MDKKEDKGLTPIIGFMLIVAILSMSWAMAQAQLVLLHKQKKIELDHNNKIISDFSNIRSDYLETTSTGEMHATSIKLGAEYPRIKYYFIHHHYLEKLKPN